MSATERPSLTCPPERRWIDPALEVCAAIAAAEPFVDSEVVHSHGPLKGEFVARCLFCQAEDVGPDTQHHEPCAYLTALALTDDGGNPKPRPHPLVQLLDAIEAVAAMDVDAYLADLDLAGAVQLLRRFRGDKNEPESGAKRQLGYLEQAVEDRVIAVAPYTPEGQPRPEVDGIRVLVHSGKQIKELDKDALVSAWVEAMTAEAERVQGREFDVNERRSLRAACDVVVATTLQFGGAGGEKFAKFGKRIASQHGIDIDKYVIRSEPGRMTVELA